MADRLARPLGPKGGIRRKRRKLIAAVVVAAAGLGTIVSCASIDRTLLRTPPEREAESRTLVAYARVRGALPYLANCAHCHGLDMHGRVRQHTPDLTDSTWLYGDGEVNEIERTILYGIRSGNPKARNVTDMPAFLFTARLNRGEISDVTEYLMNLRGHRRNAAAAARGKLVFAVRGVCYDCHGIDGGGNEDFGAPSLLTERLMYGGDRKNLETTISQGRHGLCPAWVSKLDAASVRAIALTIHANAVSNDNKT